MIEMRKKRAFVLMADDDEDFYRLTQLALRENKQDVDLRRVEDGEELMNYLMGNARFKDDCQRPDLVLLDLNMPRKNGLEALQQIRATPELREIPVVMLTISNNPQDIHKSYSLGANSFATKPIEFKDLARMMEVFQQYWFEAVQLPCVDRSS
jgi:CheY-like chemotaxis protein